jgi:hypothetical protein
MMEPEGTWPCKKSFSPAPVEEFRKDMREGACCVISKEEALDHEFPEVKKGGLDRLIRVYGYVMAAVYNGGRRREQRDP